MRLRRDQVSLNAVITRKEVVARMGLQPRTWRIEVDEHCTTGQ
jgi:hypothetical protein